MRTRYQLTFVNIIDKHVAQALVLNQKYARYVPKWLKIASIFLTLHKRLWLCMYKSIFHNFTRERSRVLLI